MTYIIIPRHIVRWFLPSNLILAGQRSLVETTKELAEVFLLKKSEHV